MDRTGCVVLTGVTGSGKSTVGEALAERLGWECLDSDSLHEDASIEKMRSGTPLNDEDREGWLARVRDWIDRHPHSVVACSALRRAYRDTLRQAGRPVWFCHLDLPYDVLAARLERRTGHFAPASLLPSQLQTLERLEPDEPGTTVDGDGTVEQVVDRVAEALSRC